MHDMTEKAAILGGCMAALERAQQYVNAAEEMRSGVAYINFNDYNNELTIAHGPRRAERSAAQFVEKREDELLRGVGQAVAAVLDGAAIATVRAVHAQLTFLIPAEQEVTTTGTTPSTTPGTAD